MECAICSSLPSLDIKNGIIYIIMESDMLFEKMRIFLNDLNINYTAEENVHPYIIKIECTDCKEVISKLKTGNLSDIEQEDANLALLEKGKSLDMLSIKQLKPLKTWFTLLDSEKFLKILEDKKIKMYMQPIVDAKSLEVVAFEMLARGIDEDGNLVYPNYLFDMAVKTNTLNYLDRICRETAVRTAAFYNIQNQKIFINFIPNSIYDPKVCLKTTIKAADYHGVSHKNLVFEVVESQRIEDVKHLKYVFDYYRSLDFKVALDDVGSGYSGLNMIVSLQPDLLKIDIELIRDIHKDPLKQSVVGALINIAKNSNIQILAEGVETKDEYEYLKDKVDLMQGYLFAKPSPEPIFEVSLN